MTCPHCNHQPITFLAFILKFNFAKIKCQNCKTNLKGNKLLNIIFYSALVFGLILGLSVAMLSDIYKWDFSTSVLVFVGVVVVVSVPADIVAWKSGDYIVNDKVVGEAKVD